MARIAVWELMLFVRSYSVIQLVNDRPWKRGSPRNHAVDTNIAASRISVPAAQNNLPLIFPSMQPICIEHISSELACEFKDSLRLAYEDQSRRGLARFGF